MKTLLDLYFAYNAQFIYNRATYMIMINSLQIYEFVCMYNARFLLYRNNTGTIHTYMYNLQIVIYRDTSPLHGHLVTKYLQIFKIQGFGYFQEDDIQLPGFYTNIPPSEFETSAPHQTQTGTPSRCWGKEVVNAAIPPDGSNLIVPVVNFWRTGLWRRWRTGQRRLRAGQR